MREIWGIGTPRSFRPIWVCEELGLQYQHHAIGPRTGETQQPEFTMLNRKQKIPFDRDECVSLSESVAICRYLAITFQTDSSRSLIRPRHSPKKMSGPPTFTGRSMRPGYM